MMSSPVRKRKRLEPVVREFEAKGLLAATHTPFTEAGCVGRTTFA